MTDTILALDGIGKSFFGVPAVRDVTLRIGRGRVLGLVGQNGAGKSTLMNILGGVLAPDAGTMRLDDTPYAPATPRDAERRGIAFIHQELNLFTNLDIAENLFIGRLSPRPRRADRPRGARRADRGAPGTVSLALPPDTLVERLSPGERQLVEVAKALQLDARIIIFDEPTTSLTPRETARLFDLIARLTADGKTIVYISHILGDVQALADDIAVMRDGRLVATGPERGVPGRPHDQPDAGARHRPALPAAHPRHPRRGAARGPRPDRPRRGARHRPRVVRGRGRRALRPDGLGPHRARPHPLRPRSLRQRRARRRRQPGRRR